jgi:hypothetical protein
MNGRHRYTAFPFALATKSLFVSGEVDNALRNRYVRDGVNVALGTRVDDFHCVVAECGDELSTLGIESEMVDSTLSVRERYGSREYQWTLTRLLLGAGEENRCRQECANPNTLVSRRLHV